MCYRCIRIKAETICDNLYERFLRVTYGYEFATCLTMASVIIRMLLRNLRLCAHKFVFFPALFFYCEYTNEFLFIFLYVKSKFLLCFFFLLHHINHENVQKPRQMNSICFSLAICCVENHEKLCVIFLSLSIDRPPSHSQLLKLHTNDFPLVLKTTKFYHYISVIFSHSTTFSLLSDIDKLELGHKRWCLFFFRSHATQTRYFNKKKLTKIK